MTTQDESGIRKAPTVRSSMAMTDRGQLTGADYTGANQPADEVYLYDQNGTGTTRVLTLTTIT